MALADRDYARHSSGRGFDPTNTSSLGRALRGWSANTWIMVICIAVFVLDLMLGSAGWMPTQSMGRIAFVQDSSLLRQAQAVTPAAVGGNITIPERAALPGASFNLLVVPADLVPPEDLAHVQTITAPGQSPLAIVGIERFRQWLPLNSIGHFSTGKGFLELQVWRLVTFQFLHADINHLFFNMVGLFFFGYRVEGRMGSKRYLSFYLACGIAGALLYLTLNFLGSVLNIRAVGLLNYDAYVTLIGASGGVFGVLMASAYYSEPGEKLLLFFVIPIPIKLGIYGLLAYQVFDLIRRSDNAGGSAAHIGGAIAGIILVRHLSVLDNFLDIFSNSKARPSKRLKAGQAAHRQHQGPTKAETKRVDAILDKVSTHGIQSLTDEERAFLDRVSKDR